jgi:hypothetical protein
MEGVEARMELGDGATEASFTGGQLLALVDSLRDGTLNEAQRGTVQALRAGILSLVVAESEVV